MTIIKWHDRFCDVAALVASWSKDPSTQVGAVITKDRMIVSTGYNGLPKRVDDIEERLTNRDLKYPMTVHAEMNAILQATTSLNDATLYVTHHPCADCAGAIIQSGIKRVFVRTPKKNLDTRWNDSTRVAKMMFIEAGVAIVDLNELYHVQKLQAAE